MNGKDWIFIAIIMGISVVVSVDIYSNATYRAATKAAKINADATIAAAKVQCQ